MGWVPCVAVCVFVVEKKTTKGAKIGFVVRMEWVGFLVPLVLPFVSLWLKKLKPQRTQ